MKTISEALTDEILYPLPLGFIENKLIARGLSGDDELTAKVLRSNGFRGAVADCLYSLATDAPNFSEADKSVSLDKSALLTRANKIYESIGESAVGTPTVYIGG
jgi:hypothetical protein